jgi:predicted dehydrogenase
VGKLRVGVIGLGLGRYHVETYSALPTVERIVVCDPDGERVEAIRREFPRVGAGYDDLDRMLADEQLDAVSVVSPDRHHRPQTEQCLDAGCHVLITKPMATTLADGRAVVDAAERSGKVVLIAQERRFRAFTRSLKVLLDERRLGGLIEVSIEQIQDKREFIAERPWAFQGEGSRTPLTGTGIHEVDRIRHLVNQPIKSVFAMGTRLGPIDISAHTTMTVLMQFDNDVIGRVSMTYEARWPKEDGEREGAFRVLCDSGMVFGHQYVVEGDDHWRDLPVNPEPVLEGSREAVRSFVDSVENGLPAEVTPRDAFASLSACMAAEESAATGRSVVPQGL